MSSTEWVLLSSGQLSSKQCFRDYSRLHPAALRFLTSCQGWHLVCVEGCTQEGFWAQTCLGVVLPLRSQSIGMYLTAREATKRGGTMIPGRRQDR